MTDRGVSLSFASALPAHAEVVEGLRREVGDSERWRWLELSCSLAAGRGDELSDIDAGVGYGGTLAPEELEREGAEVVRAVGDVADVLVHTMPGWPPEARRFAVEYRNGVQLDLVFMPASRRQGLPDGSVALVDKDAVLVEPWRPSVADPPSHREAREWVMLGWWALSDAAKHLRRGSLFEAAERITAGRQQALRLFAAARGIPYPSFGLVSLLDFAPFELPESLARTYCVPNDPAGVRRAAEAAADLLSRVSDEAAEALSLDLTTPWAEIARRRLAAASA
jgi:hypothetical protein